ncbi:hypothetical protein BDC45DRAFT_512399 [Circinella umbellata]|nr:hypothetical protein BDC45DRAFT_512399 [Circinella umbellata]
MDYGTQTSIQGVHQISDLEAKSKNIELIETMLNDLGFNSMDDLRKAMKDWRTKARLFDQVQYFIDRVDNVVWDTPYNSLLSICRQHKNLVSSMRNSPDDVCENHRTQYEKALLEAERDKNRALGSSPYSSEHLDVTFERLVRWAHTVRHVTS